MSEDFIRCYIGNVHFSMLATIQRESGKFNEWELMEGSEFDLKHSYGYIESLIRDDSLLEALAKRSVIAETRQPASVKPSILWSNAPNIADVITLLSLARARYCSTLAVEKNLGTKYSIGWGLVTEEFEGNWDIVPISNLGGFITEAITYIENNHDWLDESGFTPSIFWYEQAQKSYHTAPSVLEMGLYWVSLEILASTYIDTQGIAINNKKDRVKRFITDRGYTGSNWDFLEEVINDWYQTRCFLFHEGKQSLPRNVLIKRRQQVRDFTSLVFVEMLKQQDEARKKHLATRMQKY
jgi:hypothetical protein